MHRIRRLLPSPAMVVAVTALFVALSGSAYAIVITGASIRNNSVTGADIRNKSLHGRDARPDSLGGIPIKESRLGPVPVAEGVNRFSVVTGAGALARGRGVTSTARTAEGRYQVIFDRDVRNCAFAVSVGDAGAAGPPQGEAAVAALASNVNGVQVRTEASGGAAADRPFHLIVSC
jgi:hypothetical protein